MGVFAPMPELPEVEVTRLKIAPLLTGRKIRRVAVSAPSYFFLTPPEELVAHLRERVVKELLRHGKYLIAHLDDDSRLLLHLGMTGQLFGSGVTSVQLLRHTAAGLLTPEEQGPQFSPDQHTHLWLELEGPGGDVFFRDVRKFGKVQWLAPGASCERLDKLGVDALAADGAVLYEATRSRRVPIKTLLLDQRVLAGVGNIYADEALFQVRLSPLRAAHSVDRRKCGALLRAVQKVMRRAIETGGSSISDFIQPDGAKGGFQDERRVYGLTGLPCQRCGRPIERLVIGGRASHHCPGCQV